jgi:uncharacterized protein YyaL (SSP411 family)/aryl-alcohol dehydrogenase-like predicted oxidoreductase
MSHQADGRRHNRLAGETSPYLLQHAQNPVDWYPWGPEALARAEREDRPILLSIGYAACHWCHVMERESFEDEATARLMNEHFVNIKVDREERPDLDEIYMAATVAMSGSGGWPMTVFLLPMSHEPFFAGTYFPPRDMYGRPGFPTLLSRIAELWRRDRAALAAQARELTRELGARSGAATPLPVSAHALDAAVRQLARSFDPRHGGFGPAPKFPASMAIELLLRHHRRTGDAEVLAMVRTTLDGMERGGIYDHLAGGFARYSTDERWLVPHFEKMLYDNALLAKSYTFAWQVTGHERYRDVARETLDYVLAEMTSPDGGFYSATDADSEGEEGKFFVWTPGDLEAVLAPDQARAFAAYYDVTPEGNWEGKSVLNTPDPPAEVASRLGMPEEELRRLVGAARAKLYAARKERVPPLLDDKILCAWNALMVSAFAEGARAFADERYEHAAARSLDFLLTRMRRPDGGLYRTSRGDKTHLDAYLEDYAYLVEALVDGYEMGGEQGYLGSARELAERMVSDFGDDEHGGFFTTARHHEKLLVRMREGQDGPIPAANASAARALLRLSWHLGRAEWRQRAEAAIAAHGQLIERAPRAFAASLCVLDMLLEGPVEAVIAGPRTSAPTRELAGALGRHFVPSRMVVWHDEAEPSLAPPELVAGKGRMDGKPTLYLCRSFACLEPTSDAGSVARLLERDRELAGATRAASLGRRSAGGASAEGTQRYAARFGASALPSAYRRLGSTGLLASVVGFGSYRVDDETPGFGEALQKALEGGVNLVDTSTNYGNGGSERLVGATLARLFGTGALGRDEIIVVSKIGYVQGHNLELAQARESDGRPFAEMVKYADGCWHCIHPDFLADQLDRSLERLRLERLDVCLLHNPEYFLSDAAKAGTVTEERRDEFYRRVAAAFAFFERQVAAGRIGAYGVSSNTIAADKTAEPDATELARMIEAARQAGGDGHHFRVLQLPLNLFEGHAVLRPRVGALTVLAAAAERDLGVLANRPLNAIVGRAMMRLAEVPAAEAERAGVADALAALRAHEARFAAEVASRLSGSADFAKLFRLGEELAPVAERLDNLEQFEQLVHGQILPLVQRALGMVERSAREPGAAEAWGAWRRSYLAALERALGAIRGHTLERARQHVDRVARAIAPFLPAARLGEPLQRKALWTVASAPGVTSALLGMRRAPYVDDALAVMRWPRLERPERVFEAATKL